MKRIRDAQTILSLQEGGQLLTDLGTEITNVTAKLQEMATTPKKKVKGRVSLSLNFEVQDGVLSIEADIASKLPKEARRSTLFWVLGDGSLSTEHPQQQDMFAGPREVRTNQETVNG